MSETILTAPSEVKKRKLSGLQKAGRIAGIGALGLASGIIASTASGADTECGPHRCTVTLSFDDMLLIDGGPLGPARIPGVIELPGSIGLHVDLGQANSDSTESDTPLPLFDEQTGELNTAQLQQLGQQYSQIGESTDTIRNDLIENILGLSALSTIGWGTLYAAAGTVRRKQLLERFVWGGSFIKPLAFLLATSMIVQPTPKSYDQEEWTSTTEVFAGTPLEGLEVQGAVLELSLEGIKQVVEYREALKTYYRLAAENAVAAVSESGLSDKLKSRGENTILTIRTSDIHCNYGMNAVLSALAGELGVDLWVDSGDLVVSGLAPEVICIQQLVKNMPSDRIIAPGNHEGRAMPDTLRNNGFIVVDGTIQEVGGIPFLGLPDPNTSPFGAHRRYNHELTREIGEQLLNPAREASIPPVLLGHSEHLVYQTLSEELARYAFVGHRHHPSTTFIGREGILLTSGSTGGAEEGQLSIGKLPAGAKATINFDLFEKNEAGEVTLRQTYQVTISPDQSAEVEPIDITSD